MSSRHGTSPPDRRRMVACKASSTAPGTASVSPSTNLRAWRRSRSPARGHGVTVEPGLYYPWPRRHPPRGRRGVRVSAPRTSWTSEVPFELWTAAPAAEQVADPGRDQRGQLWKTPRSFARTARSSSTGRNRPSKLPTSRIAPPLRTGTGTPARSAPSPPLGSSLMIRGVTRTGGEPDLLRELPLEAAARDPRRRPRVHVPANPIESLSKAETPRPSAALHREDVLSPEEHAVGNQPASSTESRSAFRRSTKKPRTVSARSEVPSGPPGAGGSRAGPRGRKRS